eukprot:gene9401-1647_t
MMNGSTIDDRDDEVVAEGMNTILSSNVVFINAVRRSAESLQFPMVQEKLKAFEAEQIIKSRLKPQHNTFELDFPVDTGSNNIDRIKAEIIAENANLNPDEDESDENKTFQDDILDHTTLTATSTQRTTQHAIGVVHDGTLYVNPLQDIFQMRPSLYYLDEKDRRERLQKQMDQEEAVAGTNTKSDQEGRRKVKMQFKKKEIPRVIAARERSLAYYHEKFAEEPWIHMPVVPKSTPRAAETTQKLIESSNYPVMVNSSQDDYIDRLFPRVQLPNIMDQKCIIDIQSKQPADAVSDLLRKAEAVTLDDILRYIPNEHAVLEALQTCAIMLRGNWVALSHHVLGTTKEGNAQPLTLARNLMSYVLSQLWCFHKGYILTRQDIISKCAVRKEDAEMLLKPLPDDPSLENRYPNIFRQQQGVWEQLRHELESHGIDPTPAVERLVMSPSL